MAMASVLNITDRLKKETKQIQIGEDVLTINTAFEAMVEIEAIERTEISDSEKMLKTLEILLGKDYKKLKDMQLDVADMKVVFIAIMATVNACTYEEMESRFQAIEQ
jgi:hypothetical protein